MIKNGDKNIEMNNEKNTFLTSENPRITNLTANILGVLKNDYDDKKRTFNTIKKT